jgi:hypothetical protein
VLSKALAGTRERPLRGCGRAVWDAQACGEDSCHGWQGRWWVSPYVLVVSIVLTMWIDISLVVEVVHGTASASAPAASS